MCLVVLCYFAVYLLSFGLFGLGGGVGLFGVGALDFACACSGSFTFGFLLLLVWVLVGFDLFAGIVLSGLI